MLYKGALGICCSMEPTQTAAAATAAAEEPRLATCDTRDRHPHREQGHGVSIFLPQPEG